MPPRPLHLDTLLARLHGKLGTRVSTEAEELDKVAADESGLPKGCPGGVVWPLTTEEVALVAREAAALGVPLVPRGAGTGKAGGAIPLGGELVVDLSRMHQLLSLRPQDLYAVVQPGLVNQQLSEAALAAGYMYPPDPASYESCSLGGNISTNAGGSRAVKYGSTVRYVWGLTLVRMGGEVLTMGRRSIKGVAGYDVTSLCVGSEGTLGFVTEAILHIIPAPPAIETAWLAFADPLVASRASEHIFAAGLVPRMMELLDAQAIAAVRAKSPFRIPEGGAGLLVETDGRDELAFHDLSRICEIALEHGATASAVATNEHDREAMRRARRLVSSCLKEAFPHKISDDIAVPRSRMAELLVAVQALASEAHLDFAAYGHLGDGNVHMNMLCKSAEERERAKPLRRQVLKLVVGLGGTITGEHGIGIAKRDFLDLEQSTALIELQRQLKRAFDPQNLLNPGKGLPLL
jgi:glycolate oxidase